MMILRTDLSTSAGVSSPYCCTKQLSFSASYGTQAPSKCRGNPNGDPYIHYICDIRYIHYKHYMVYIHYRQYIHHIHYIHSKHSNALHYIKINFHYLTLTLHCTALHYIHYISLRCFAWLSCALRCTTLCFLSFANHYVHELTFHLHDMTLHHIT